MHFEANIFARHCLSVKLKFNHQFKIDFKRDWIRLKSLEGMKFYQLSSEKTFLLLENKLLLFLQMNLRRGDIFHLY